MLAPREFTLGGASLVDQLPAQTVAGRTSLSVAMFDQAALPREDLDRELAAVFAGHPCHA